MVRAGEPGLAAAGLLVASLLLATLPDPRPRPPSCAEPVERETDGVRSLSVACSGAGGPPRGPARRLFGLPLDPNRVDRLTLETLPGIGPARAAAILRAREERPFESVSALDRVPGIGPVTLRRIAPHLAVGKPASREIDSLTKTQGRAGSDLREVEEPG